MKREVFTMKSPFSNFLNNYKDTIAIDIRNRPKKVANTIINLPI